MTICDLTISVVQLTVMISSFRFVLFVSYYSFKRFTIIPCCRRRLLLLG